MIKNNLKSFLIHVIISIISGFVAIIFTSGQPKWVSEEAANNHHYSMMVIAVIIIAIAAISYFLSAKKHLINQGSLYKNFFSVSFTSILGIFFWLVTFIIYMTGPNNYLLNPQIWEYYSVYNGYSLFLLIESKNNNPFIFLLFSFIPTIAMWAGIQQKKLVS